MIEADLQPLLTKRGVLSQNWQRRDDATDIEDLLRSLPKKTIPVALPMKPPLQEVVPRVSTWCLNWMQNPPGKYHIIAMADYVYGVAFVRGYLDFWVQGTLQHWVHSFYEASMEQSWWTPVHRESTCRADLALKGVTRTMIMGQYPRGAAAVFLRHAYKDVSDHTDEACREARVEMNQEVLDHYRTCWEKIGSPLLSAAEIEEAWIRHNYPWRL